jgi:hypothetical protein
MDCKHEHLKCTDNVYFCADCGRSWVVPDKDTPTEEKPAEAQKTVKKRAARKETK